ncbi:MAG: hypothetical protein LBH97_07625 [Treponema sp.]|jgi:rRNA maturation endonuclease Nob1|nr:hypothetical protein [Treponema sp.]
MDSFIEILVFVTIGIALLWFAYMLLTGQIKKIRKYRQQSHKEGIPDSGVPGDPQVCPICSSRLIKGQLVKTQAFPSSTGGKDRLMYIQGCVYCLGGKKQRICPVCGASLNLDEILIARLFERSIRRNHVHILGCSRCRRAGK